MAMPAPFVGTLAAILWLTACSGAVPYEQPDASVDPGGECIVQVGPIQDVDLGDGYESTHGLDDMGLGFAVDGEALVMGARTGPDSPSPWSWAIVRYDLATAAVTEAYSDEGDGSLLDAADGRALVALGEIRMIDLDSGGTTTLFGLTGGWYPYELDVVRRPRGMVQGAQAAWVDENGVYFHDGEAPALIDATAERAIPFPQIDGEHVFYSAFDWTGATGGTGWVYRYGADGITVLGTDIIHNPGLHVHEGRAMWGTATGVTIFEGGSAREILAVGEVLVGCSDTFVEGSGAAFVCDGARLYRHDLSTDVTTLVATMGEGAALGGPRLNSDGVMVWVELPDACGQRGEIFLEHRGDVRSVSQIATDNYCVGHLPIPVSLHLTDTHVVWSEMGGVRYASLQCVDN